MKIAFIGSNGIPNVYGGFESFLESVCPKLIEKGHSICVTCDPKMHPSLDLEYKGVKKIYINIRANGVMSTLHDLVAFLKVVRMVDKVVVLGVSAGPFFLLFRVICEFLNVRLITNIDGVEWRRGKHNHFVRIILWFYDLIGQFASHAIIYDNKALLSYVKKPFRNKSFYVAYAADHVLYNVNSQPIVNSCLTICRIEPENNIEMIINGFLESTLSKYCIVGNWQKSEYGIRIFNKYKENTRLELLDPIYNQNTLMTLRGDCSIYIHGHSVGGTNPSLVEMLGYKCNLLCYECDFNRESVGEDAEYFLDENHLSLLLNQKHNKKVDFVRVMPERYTSEYIADRYAEI